LKRTTSSTQLSAATICGSLAHAIVAAKEIGVPINGYEIQMLFGMAEPVRQAIIRNGQRVRVYLPVGELLPGISYLIRRLMENTSNTSFLRQTYAEKKTVDALIKPPAVAQRRQVEKSMIGSVFIMKRRSILPN
jgi:RHH-type proline utilization regulon transcriptional repressor/proline dehydrogenase/delta 1-pyrroline-5-carboxylate dehydrogenase